MNGARRLVAVVALFGAVTGTLAHAAADDGASGAPPSTAVELESPSGLPPLEWRWRRFSALDYGIGLAGGAITLAMAIVPPVPTHAIQGPVLFDTSVRNALRAPNLQGRYKYRDISDVGVSLAVTWPFFADALTTAWWYRGSRDTAEQMALIDLQALGVIGAIQGVTNVVVSRERPYGPDCGNGELPSNADDCVGATRYRSFFSGHSAFSFTGAALICVHHLKHDLIGAPWDVVSCAGGYAVATTTALFRVVADMHYATDVLTGALAGTLVGYGVPLLHYAFPTRGRASDGVELTLAPAPGGASLLGVF